MTRKLYSIDFQDLCKNNKIDTIVTDKTGQTYVFQVEMMLDDVTFLL